MLPDFDFKHKFYKKHLKFFYFTRYGNFYETSNKKDFLK